MSIVNKRGLTKKTTTMEEESDDSDYGEDMLTMVEEDDLEFLRNAIDSQSYGILKQVKRNSSSRNEVKAKRKRSSCISDDETMEQEYEDQVEAPAKLKDLLPIKTGRGIIRRTVSRPEEESEVSEEEEEEEEDEYVFEETDEAPVPKSPAQLLAAYSYTLQNKKLEIGALCAALLENPEEKITNFNSLLQMVDESSGDARFSVRKIALVSLLEVFKDVIPSYQIKNHDAAGGVKLRKDTLKLRKYEEALLLYYRKYLQRLEKFTVVLYKKRAGGANVRETRELGEISVRALCDLLVAHPYFNFAPNIAQAVVPFLNHASPSVRQTVSSACKVIFKEDKREEITLKILRVLNHHVRSRPQNVRPDALEVLLHLRVKEVDLDAEREHEIRRKKLAAKKQNILQLSKKERKRKKRLEQLEKEMLETKAEENKQGKQKNLTEIVKIVFGIYFRTLKSCSANTKVLGVCLEGLAKYSHCINLDYYMDLLNLLDGLLKQEGLGLREQLHCIQTVFAILAEQGEALNLDPSRFHSALYRNLLAAGAPDVLPAVLKTLDDLLVKRRKKITGKRLFGFTKRTATLSLQLLHNGALACLGVVKHVLHLNKTADVLLDLDVTTGDGDYQPELDDPEYCNAASTSLYELALLTHHYHPVVTKFAQHIAGAANLSAHYGKLSPAQLYEEFDPSYMTFNPAVPAPRHTPAKAKSRRSHRFTEANFQSYCDEALRRASLIGVTTW